MPFKLGDPKSGIITDKERTIIEQAGPLGLNYNELFRLFRVDRQTWKDFVTRNPDVPNVYEEGLRYGQLDVGQSLLKQAKQGNMNAIRWWEMTRRGKAERVEAETRSVQYVVEAPAAQSPDEWAAEYSGVTDETVKPPQLPDIEDEEVKLPRLPNIVRNTNADD